MATTSDWRLSMLLGGAQRHGQESEPDHEVGDLQQLLRACWERLPPDAKREVYAASREVTMWARRAKGCVKCRATIAHPVLAAREPERCANCADPA